MARLVLRDDLETMVAARMVRPKVDHITGQLAENAGLRAPDGKIWVTAKDPKVRPAHEHADSQVLPDNVRYRLRKMVYVRKGRGPDGKAINPAGGWVLAPGGGWDLAQEPRDEALPPGQREQCRCQSLPLPGVVARSIHAAAARVEGARVSGEVYSDFHRVKEAEFGDGANPGAAFMRGALALVGALYSGRR